jgi:hypothetical protein
MLLLAALLLFSLTGGCISSYQVEILRAHEMIQDMEAIELDDPDLAEDYPENGIVVNNKTERTLVVMVRRKKEQSIRVKPGASGSLALAPGPYRYKIYEDTEADEPKSKAVYIHLRGTKKIVEKCVFVYDVFTQSKVVDDKEFEKLKNR